MSIRFLIRCPWVLVVSMGNSLLILMMTVITTVIAITTIAAPKPTR